MAYFISPKMIVWACEHYRLRRTDPESGCGNATIPDEVILVGCGNELGWYNQRLLRHQYCQRFLEVCRRSGGEKFSRNDHGQLRHWCRQRFWNYVGGLVGENSGTIMNSYATGTSPSVVWLASGGVNHGTITACFWMSKPADRVMGLDWIVRWNYRPDNSGDEDPFDIHQCGWDL